LKPASTHSPVCASAHTISGSTDCHPKRPSKPVLAQLVFCTPARRARAPRCMRCHLTSAARPAHAEGAALPLRSAACPDKTLRTRRRQSRRLPGSQPKIRRAAEARPRRAAAPGHGGAATRCTQHSSCVPCCIQRRRSPSTPPAHLFPCQPFFPPRCNPSPCTPRRAGRPLPATRHRAGRAAVPRHQLRHSLPVTHNLPLLTPPLDAPGGPHIASASGSAAWQMESMLLRTQLLGPALRHERTSPLA